MHMVMELCDHGDLSK